MSSKLRLILMFIIAAGFTFITEISAQDSLLNKLVTARFKNTSLKTALKRIEQQLNCYFTFDGSTINPDKIINQSFKSVPLKSCLDYMLEDSDLVYKSIDNHVIIKKNRMRGIRPELQDTLPKIILIKGQIVDSQGDGPLAYASVGIVGHGLGSICNLQGEFILKIPGHLIEEKICISHLGYVNRCIPVKQAVDTFMVLRLERSYIAIQEVIIRKTDPKSLIRLANSKIAQNYYTKPAYLISFYRESVKRRENYMFFSEAVVKIYKSSYTRVNENDLIKVLKSRKIKDIRQEDTVILKLKSGLNTCLELDIVKNKIDFLNEEYFDSYNYNMSDIVTYNDRNAYLIEFEQKKSVDDAFFQGKIYIDIEKLAIIGAEFSINPQKVSKAQSSYVVRKNKDIRIKMSEISYMVNYRLINDKYYLNYVRGSLKMKVKKNDKIFPIDFETSLEMAVNDVDTIEIERFKRSEIENPYTIFSDNFYEYDESFWGNYNFIKPEDELQESIRNLSFKIEE